jgi:hypothetical protein
MPVDKIYSNNHDIIGSLGYNEWKGRKLPQVKVKYHRISS